MNFAIRRQTRGVWMMALILVACSAEERTTTLDQSYVEKIAEHPNVVVIAPNELIGATVMISASDRRMLWPDTLLERSRWRFWRRLFGLKDPAPNAAKAYLELAPGKHSLVITHDRYENIVRTIELRDDQQEVRVDATELVPKSSSGP